LRSVPLPQTTVVSTGPGPSVRGVFGYASHAGNTLLWIAATGMGGNETASVETSAVYSARL
jgi:hypothetical protein